ncbi:hypothetical protein BTM25_36310 [Actinomadura rubteroloni]|uniref:Uncharacterized protein n=1 Tax=Actinomadura rubteroloni TaxID=1926885 RepID=A0A2P4UIY1_9ACTN|nr:hypothetical protein [Actinomadura rubteroloni]POM24990.1 hypothetical protein BTM25_36310 [Actinomadura rubteroloni]
MSLEKPCDGGAGDSARNGRPRRLTTDMAMVRLGVLDQAAHDAHRMTTEVTSVDGGQNHYVRLDRPGRAPARVFCAPRAEDSDRPWLYGDGDGDGGVWIADASGGAGVTAALAWLKGKADAQADEQADQQAGEQARM